MNEYELTKFLHGANTQQYKKNSTKTKLTPDIS